MAPWWCGDGDLADPPLARLELDRLADDHETVVGLGEDTRLAELAWLVAGMSSPVEGVQNLLKNVCGREQ